MRICTYPEEVVTTVIVDDMIIYSYIVSMHAIKSCLHVKPVEVVPICIEGDNPSSLSISWCNILTVLMCIHLAKCILMSLETFSIVLSHKQVI